MGFTLIEVSVATTILVTVCVAIASLSLSSLNAGSANENRFTAAVLLEDRFAALRYTELSNSEWIPGGSLDAAARVVGYFDYAAIAPDNTIRRSSNDSSLPYLRLWQIDGVRPRLLTVVVLDNRQKETTRAPQNIRGTITVSPKW